MVPLRVSTTANVFRKMTNVTITGIVLTAAMNAIVVSKQLTLLNTAY